MFGCGWNVYLLAQKYLGKTGFCVYHWLPLGEYPGYGRTSTGSRIGEFRRNYWQNCITVLACTRSDIGCTAVTQLYTG